MGNTTMNNRLLALYSMLMMVINSCGYSMTYYHEPSISLDGGIEGVVLSSNVSSYPWSTIMIYYDNNDSIKYNIHINVSYRDNVLISGESIALIIDDIYIIHLVSANRTDVGQYNNTNRQIVNYYSVIDDIDVIASAQTICFQATLLNTSYNISLSNRVVRHLNKIYKYIRGKTLFDDMPESTVVR